MQTISIEVDEEAAKSYSQASVEERRKLQFLLSLRLRELTLGPIRPLSVVMDEIGKEAESRGMTPDVLESLLRDE